MPVFGEPGFFIATECHYFGRDAHFLTELDV